MADDKSELADEEGTSCNIVEAFGGPGSSHLLDRMCRQANRPSN